MYPYVHLACVSSSAFVNACIINGILLVFICRSSSARACLYI